MQILAATSGTAQRPTTGRSPHADADSDRRDSAAPYNRLFVQAPMQMLPATGRAARRPTIGERSARQHLLEQEVKDSAVTRAAE